MYWYLPLRAKRYKINKSMPANIIRAINCAIFIFLSLKILQSN